MLTAATAKYLQSLRLGKFRQKYNKFVAEGDKCTREFLKAKKYTVDAIFASSHWVELHSNLLSQYRDIITIVDQREMKKISLLKTPTEVFLLCDQKELIIKDSLKEESTLYLDGIQNPGNMGTILRTADWYGIQQVVCSQDAVDFYHPKVIQAAMGSHNNINHFTADLIELKALTSLQLLGTSLDGEVIKRGESLDPCIIVIGNEGKGIRKEYKEVLDRKILIQGVDCKIAESLNAAIACAIVLDKIFGQ